MQYKYHSTYYATEPVQVSLADVYRLQASHLLRQAILISRAELSISRGDYNAYSTARNDFEDNRDALLSPVFRETLRVDDISVQFPTWSWNAQEEIDVPFDDGEFDPRFIDEREEAEQFGEPSDLAVAS